MTTHVLVFCTYNAILDLFQLENVSKEWDLEFYTFCEIPFLD